MHESRTPSLPQLKLKTSRANKCLIPSSHATPDYAPCRTHYAPLHPWPALNLCPAHLPVAALAIVAVLLPQVELRHDPHLLFRQRPLAQHYVQPWHAGVPDLGLRACGRRCMVGNR